MVKILAWACLSAAVSAAAVPNDDWKNQGGDWKNMQCPKPEAITEYQTKYETKYVPKV